MKQLFVIYRCSPTQIIYELDASGRVLAKHETPGPRWAYGQIKGGTAPVPYEGKLLRVFHSTLDNDLGAQRRRYFVGACLMEPKPPFEIIRVSTKPILYGSEIDTLKPERRRECHHWKANVVFPGGLVEGDGFWYLALGVNDSACALAMLFPSQLNF